MRDALEMRDFYLSCSEEVRDEFASIVLIGDIAQRLGTPPKKFFKEQREKASGNLRKLLMFVIKNPYRQKLMDALFEEKIKQVKA